MSAELDLLDYRRRVGEMYRSVREDGAAFAQFCQQRDSLFKTHPQSALDETQKEAFWISTMPTTHPAPTAPVGSARCHRRRINWRFR